ncbi:GtrA family protein [Propionibacteriaceae bacterium G1746]|uniref:GtrA family protein n=1 Tax=Aestuariimicrobium sp. G57 TaxID=3418485 RepID=UPI003C26FD24
MTSSLRLRAEHGFGAVVGAIHSWLPGVLRRIPRTFIGFAIINSFTFGVDMLLLSLTHGVGHVPYPVAVSISYGGASLLAFVLNKVLNFRSHGQAARQSARYTFVVVSNYVIWILGFSTLLEVLGVQYQVARVSAALIEGAYIYLLSRFWVFGRRRTPAPVTPVAALEAASAPAPLPVSPGPGSRG